MAKRGTKGDIDAVRSALRPRMGALAIAGTGAPAATLPAHTHSADKITFEPSGHEAADDVQEAIEELDSEKLARDGSQTMLGSLDMNHFDVNNIRDAEVESDLSMTGPAGEAKITGARELNFNPTPAAGEGEINSCRQLHMLGIDENGEGRIDGLEHVIFSLDVAHAIIEDASRIELNKDVTAGTDYTPQEGVLSWDDLEGTLVTYVRSGPSNGLVKVALDWAVIYCTGASGISG